MHLAWAATARSAPPGDDVPGAADACRTLTAGFTTVRNLGSTGGTDTTLRAAIESGRVPGPRMLISGPGLGPTGGVCDQVFAGKRRLDRADRPTQRSTPLSAPAPASSRCAPAAASSRASLTRRRWR